jgi:hypothetical protein
VEKYGRTTQVTDDSVIWRMLFACWKIMATDTHSEYVILTAFPRKYAHANAIQSYVYTNIFSLVTHTFTCSYIPKDKVMLFYILKK